MKDYDTWNKTKKTIESRATISLSFHEREIWWCSIGLNIGDEEDGKNNLFERPVLVFRKFNRNIAWVLPITTKHRYGPYYFPLDNEMITNSVILSQLRLISTKRFRRYVRKISTYEFALIKGLLIDLVTYH